MNHNSYIPVTIDQKVKEFLDEMRNRTGAGPDFLITMRPAIHRMFQTVSPENLPAARDAFLRKAELHVQTLSHLSNTLSHLERLSEQEKANPALTPAMARQLEFTRGIVVNTLLKTYGGFGPRATILG
ncbi:MAG: hypothetical protein JXR76_28205 [Deltaproteobacteria bacterium]|nr:hypothetical protein [Deltaproteobacteria bacterium]